MTRNLKYIDRICLSFVVLVTLIGACLMGHFWIEKRKIVEQREQLMSKRSQELRKADGDLRLLKEARELKREEIRSINERIPQSAEIGDFLKQLDTLIKKNEIGLVSIRPTTPIKDKYFLRIPIQLLCQGSFIRIYELLRDLEDMKRVVIMEEITISRPDITKACNLKLTAAILQYGDNNI